MESIIQKTLPQKYVLEFVKLFPLNHVLFPKFVASVYYKT